MARDILILDCPEIGCPLVLLYVFTEFAGYFKRHGHTVSVVKNVSDLHDNSIVLMGNTIKCDNPIHLLKTSAPNAIYIGWYWQDIDVSELPYFIYTYENFLNIHYNPTRYPELLKIRSFKYNTPFLLRANEDPSLIGTYVKHIKHYYCYMGWKYCEHLVPKTLKEYIMDFRTTPIF